MRLTRVGSKKNLDDFDGNMPAYERHTEERRNESDDRREKMYDVNGRRIYKVGGKQITQAEYDTEASFFADKRTKAAEARIRQAKADGREADPADVETADAHERARKELARRAYEGGALRGDDLLAYERENPEARTAAPTETAEDGEAARQGMLERLAKQGALGGELRDEYARAQTDKFWTDVASNGVFGGSRLYRDALGGASARVESPAIRSIDGRRILEDADPAQAYGNLTKSLGELSLLNPAVGGESAGAGGSGGGAKKISGGVTLTGGGNTGRGGGALTGTMTIELDQQIMTQS